MEAKRHPYTDLEKTELWKILEKAVQELSDNTDIKVQTNRNYIVGYLAKSLTENGVIKSKPL